MAHNPFAGGSGSSSNPFLSSINEQHKNQVAYAKVQAQQQQLAAIKGQDQAASTPQPAQKPGGNIFRRAVNLVNNDVVKPVVNVANKAGNTIDAGVHALKGAAGAGIDLALGTKEQAAAYAGKEQAKANQFLDHGAGGVGGYINSTQAQSRGTGTKGLVNDFVKPVASATADIAPLVVPLGKAAEGASLAMRVARGAAENAAVGGTTTALSGAANGDFSIKNTLKNAAAAGVLGGVAPIAGAVTKRVGSLISNKIDTVADVRNAAVKDAVNHVDDVIEGKVQPDGTVPRNPDGSINAAEYYKEARQVAEDKYKVGFAEKAKDFVAKNVNPLGFVRKIDQAKAASLGIDYKDLPATQSLEHQIQIRGNTKSDLGQLTNDKTSTGDSFRDLANKYKAGSDEAQAFNDYTTSKYDLDRRTNGRTAINNDLSTEDLQKHVTDYETAHPDAVKDLTTKNEFYGNAAKSLKDSGLFSDKEYNDIVNSSDVATPFNRIFADKEALDPQNVPGGRLGSKGKQTVIKQLKGGNAPIDNSFDVTIQRVHKALQQAQDNKIANLFRENTEQGLISGARVFQEAGAAEGKAAARASEREANKNITKISKNISLTKREAGKLDTEINNLNKKGLSESFKSLAQRKDALKVSTRTITKTVAEKIKKNAPQTLDELKVAYKVKEVLQKEYGTGEKAMQGIAADIFNGGKSQFLETNPGINRNTITSIVNQVFKKDVVIPEMIARSSEFETKNSDVIKSVMHSLTDPATTSRQVASIQKKIAIREPKLAAKLDKLVEHKQALEAEQAAKLEAKDLQVSLTREKTDNKTFISGAQNGQTFRIEMPPKILNGLDALAPQKANVVLKAIGAVNQVFKIAWVGALSPGFAIKSAIWDTTMGVVNSSDGIKTLAPKAVIASMKAMFESDDLLKALRKNGASTFGSSQLGIHEEVSHESLAATKDIFSRVKFSAKHPQAAIDSLDVFGGKLASLTRTRVAYAAAARTLRQKGIKVTKENMLADKDALANAVYSYNNIMPDFSTISPLIRQINTVIPFASASVAGTRSLAQAFKRQPIMTAAKVTAMGVTPAIAIAAYSMSSQSGKEYYQDMQDAGKTSTLDNNLNIVLPGAHKDPKTGIWTGVIKIPMTPEFRNLNSQAWRSMAGTKGVGGASPMKTAADTFDFITGGVRTLSNPLLDIKTVLDGKDPQTGEQIIGGKLANLPKDQQQFTTTSAAGRLVGKVFNTSPIQGDKILGQFGVAGSAVKRGNVGEALADNTANTYYGAQGESASNAFYKTYLPVKAKRDATSTQVTQLVKSGNINQAKRVAQEYNDSLTGKFSEVANKYGKSDAYNKDWDKMLNSLYISTSDNSFKARAKP